MHKLIKTIVLLALIATCAAGCTKTATQTPSQTTNAKPTNPTESYNNATAKISFTYPTQFKPTSQDGYSNLENTITQVGIDQTNYPNTNFVDAAFTVSSQAATSQELCLLLNVPEGAAGFNNPTKINGITFYQNTTKGAAAGNIYDSKTYRTFKNNTCYELNETIHTGNIGNYEPSVTEINAEPIWQQLDSIKESFTFTK